MAKRNATTTKRERCRPYAHQWQQDVCMVCHADSPAGARSRAWNAMMARMVAAGPHVYDVPPPPDYSTRAAMQDRALEGGTRDPW